MLWFFVGLGILAVLIAVLQILTWKNNKEAGEEERLRLLEEAERRRIFPLIYSDKALEKHFSVRLNVVRKSLETIDRIDYVGARDDLVTAVVYQECGDGKAFITALHNAEAVLEMQYDDPKSVQV